MNHDIHCIAEAESNFTRQLALPFPLHFYPQNENNLRCFKKAFKIQPHNNKIMMNALNA